MKAKYPVIDGKKICLTCEIEKSVDEFYTVTKKNRPCILSSCKVCSNKALTEREKARREEKKLSTPKVRTTIESKTSKTCTKCGEEKSLEEFYKTVRKNKDYVFSYCKVCANKAVANNRESYKEKTGCAYSSVWKRNNKAQAKIHDQTCALKIKQKLVTGYGGKCTCCGETQIEFLTLEHLNHDGKAHRLAVAGATHRGGKNIYRDVIARNFPPEYTILCMNCNYVERYGTPCPHKIIKKEIYTTTFTSLEHCYETYQDW